MSRLRNRRIAASAGVGVTQRLVQIGCTLILMPILLHKLGPAHFGIWGAASSLAWFIGLADFGTGSALVTLIAASIARDQLPQARVQITGAIGVGCCVAAAMLTVLLVGSTLVSGSLVTTCYMLAILGLAINVPLSSANNVWMALQKGFIASSWELVQTLLTTATLIYASTSTSDVRVYVALVYLCIVVSNLGSMLHLFLAHPELRPETSVSLRSAIREVARSGLMYFALGLSGSLSFMLDNVLALQLLGPEAAAQMTIAMRICMTGLGLIAVMAQPFWPAFTDAAHKADYQWIRKSLYTGSAFLSASTFIAGGLLVFYGRTLLRVWLNYDLGFSRGLLIAVALWLVAQAMVRLPHLFLNAISQIRFQTYLFAVATLVAFTLKFAVALRAGVSGILWSTTATVAFIVVPMSLWKIGLRDGQSSQMGESLN